MSDFRETLYTINKHGHRNWVYSSVIKGWFFRKRAIVICVLLAVYLLMPWILISGKQAVLLDIANRKFIFFGATFWATDTKFLVMILGALGISLFFFTALLGRVWCGWACPETVFLEFLFRPIERLIEGNSAERKRLDAAPWSTNKLVKKGTKFLIFAILSWILASTFLAYFVGRDHLISMMNSSPTENMPVFLATLFMMSVCLFQFGWFREQFCTVLCPYARFQSVLLDSNSLLVGYDKKRGEPRGKLDKVGNKNQGDCIDCELCVRVCPTGIDIRNGLQLECIQCAQCADACDSIMTKIGKPMGLVRYSTEKALEGNKAKIFRPRIILYAVALTIYATIFLYFLSHRQLSEFLIIRGAGNVPYTTLDDGRISNPMYVHLSNKSEHQSKFILTVENQADVELILPGSPYSLNAEEQSKVPIFINFKADLLVNGKAKIVIRVEDDHGFSASQQITLLGPDGPPKL